MSQNIEKARAIKLAGKLLDNRGRSEAELEKSMQKLQQIMKTFNLSITDITLANADYKTISVPMLRAKGCPMSGRLTAEIADFTNTKRWRERGKRKYYQGMTPSRYTKFGRYVRSRPCMKSTVITAGVYKFFGIQQDVEMAQYLYEMIANSMKVALAEYKKSEEYQFLTKGEKRSALYSFQHSFCSRVGWRLSELNAQTDREMASTGTDIVHDKTVAREAKFKEQVGIKLVSSRSSGSGGNSESGSWAGSSAGSKVSLNRPVAGNSSSTLLLS